MTPELVRNVVGARHGEVRPGDDSRASEVPISEVRKGDGPRARSPKHAHNGDVVTARRQQRSPQR